MDIAVFPPLSSVPPPPGGSLTRASRFLTGKDRANAIGAMSTWQQPVTKGSTDAHTHARGRDRLSGIPPSQPERYKLAATDESRAAGPVVNPSLPTLGEVDTGKSPPLHLENRINFSPDHFLGRKSLALLMLESMLTYVCAVQKDHHTYVWQHLNHHSCWPNFEHPERTVRCCRAHSACVHAPKCSTCLPIVCIDRGHEMENFL